MMIIQREYQPGYILSICNLLIPHVQEPLRRHHLPGRHHLRPKNTAAAKSQWQYRVRLNRRVACLHRPRSINTAQVSSCFLTRCSMTPLRCIWSWPGRSAPIFGVCDSVVLMYIPLRYAAPTRVNVMRKIHSDLCKHTSTKMIAQSMESRHIRGLCADDVCQSHCSWF